MLKIVLWIALACAVVLGALALSRSLGSRSDPAPAAAPPEQVAAPAAEDAAAPVVETAPVIEPAGPPPPPIDDQVAEDAAAVGMTTREPSEEPATDQAPEEMTREPTP
jgi:hypothetical protein